MMMEMMEGAGGGMPPGPPMPPMEGAPMEPPMALPGTAMAPPAQGPMPFSPAERATILDILAGLMR
jgi:hypothetical protein